MTREDFEKFLKENLLTKTGALNAAKTKHNFAWVKKYHPEAFKFIEDFRNSSEELKGLSGPEILAMLKWNLSEVPRCKNCGVRVKLSTARRPSEYCKKCSTKYRRSPDYESFLRSRENTENKVRLKVLKYCSEFQGDLSTAKLKKDIESTLKNVSLSSMFVSWRAIDNKLSLICGVLKTTEKIIPIDFSTISSLRLSERFYLILNGLEEIPRCLVCGEPRLFISLYKGYRPSCGKLSCRHKLGNFNRLKTTTAKLQENIDSKKFELIEYNGWQKDSIIRCKRCNKVFEHRFKDGSFIRSLRCPECDKISSLESTLKSFIVDELKLEVVERKRFTLDNKTFEVDLLIPELNLGIEANGTYWHSIRTKNKNYHLEKTKFFEKLGVTLLHFWDFEIENKLDIVKSIIRIKVGKAKQKIFARKCRVVPLDLKTYQDFLVRTHLAGYAAAKYKYGLFYKDKLVEVIGISRRSLSKSKSHLELVRLSSELDTVVVGGFSKLLSFAKNDIGSLNNLVIFADRRISNGKTYNKFFKFEYETSPSYFSRKNDLVLSRFSTMKSKLHKVLENFDESLTELENLTANGFNVCYDCGSLKFTLKEEETK